MEIDDFKRELENKRHQEVLNLLKQSLDNKKAENLIDANNKILEQFVSKLESISKDKPIDVNVETNQDLVVKEIANLTKQLKENISDFKNNLNRKVSIDLEELKPFLEKQDKVEEWIFDVKRNKDGFIETIIAREK